MFISTDAVHQITQQEIIAGTDGRRKEKKMNQNKDKLDKAVGIIKCLKENKAFK